MIGKEKYRPGMAFVSESTPQSSPELFTDAEILGEVKYLLRLNKIHGTHVLRVAAYLKLERFLRERTEATGAVVAGKGGTPVHTP